MRINRCIGCDQDFDPRPRRADTLHCPECEPLRYHRGPNGGRLPVAVLRSLGTTCGICGGTVDLTIRRPDPRAPSVDHIVARTNGGTDEIDNLQIAHIWCNQAKHLRPGIDPFGHAERQRFYNLRAWRRFAANVRQEEPTCRVCGAPSQCAVHITPLVLGGSPWDRSNVMATCKRCRNRKAQRTYEAMR